MIVPGVIHRLLRGGEGSGRQNSKDNKWLKWLGRIRCIMSTWHPDPAEGGAHGVVGCYIPLINPPLKRTSDVY